MPAYSRSAVVTVDTAHRSGYSLLLTYLGHAAINDEVLSVDETTFIASQEEHCLSLLYCFTETAAGEVDFATVALGCVVAEPILEEWGAVLC